MQNMSDGIIRQMLKCFLLIPCNRFQAFTRIYFAYYVRIDISSVCSPNRCMRVVEFTMLTFWLNRLVYVCEVLLIFYFLFFIYKYIFHIMYYVDRFIYFFLFLIFWFIRKYYFIIKYATCKLRVGELAQLVLIESFFFTELVLIQKLYHTWPYHWVILFMNQLYLTSKLNYAQI